ncbi:MAG: hypothetical protein R3B59_09740 [Dehalococcoidia bacterium]
MRYELYYDASEADQPLDVPENEGLPDAGAEPIVRRLREAATGYASDVDVVDVSGFTREQLEDAYVSRAVPPSVRRQYGVKRVFGTNKYAGSRFGRGVPALVVLEDGRPVDVYPHEEEGRIVTIADYLRRLEARATPADGAALVARMEAVRARFTGVGMTATELIEEGRRR